MSLFNRVTTWAANQVLKAANLNGEFDNLVNGLNNLDSATTSWTNVKAATITGTGASSLVINGSTISYVPWTAYTPTFSAGFGTVATQNCAYRVWGGSMEIRGVAAAGTVTGGNGTITIPAGYTINTTNFSGGGRDFLGFIFAFTTSTMNIFTGPQIGVLFYAAGEGSTKLAYGYDTGSHGFVEGAVSPYFLANEYFAFNATFQI